MKKAVAEFIGTFALVLIGCGTAVIAGMGSGPTAVDILGIAVAFGLTIVAMAYGIGQVSGCHINPAVSFGALVAGRMTGADFVLYVIAQVLGAIAGAAVLYLILSGKASGWTGGLGQNGWGPGYLGEYGLGAAFTYEAVGTFLFLVCILGVTQKGAPVGLAGLAIGLTLVALHLLGINITGTSVNPARSLGPAIVGYATNPLALQQVWLFIVAPLIGAGVAGLLFKSGLLAADDVVPVRGAADSDVAPGASAPVEPAALNRAALRSPPKERIGRRTSRNTRQAPMTKRSRASSAISASRSAIGIHPSSHSLTRMRSPACARTSCRRSSHWLIRRPNSTRRSRLSETR